MSRLIDADALKENVPNTNVDIFENCRNCSTLMDWQVKELIDKMPTIDAVEVVRCRDCKYFGEYCDEYKEETQNDGMCELDIKDSVTFDFFCADGERRDPCS